MVRKTTKEILAEHIPDEILGMIKIYVFGTVQFMLDWLLDNEELSPEKVAKIWEVSLPQPLKQYLYND